MFVEVKLIHLVNISANKYCYFSLSFGVLNVSRGNFLFCQQDDRVYSLTLLPTDSSPHWAPLKRNLSIGVILILDWTFALGKCIHKLKQATLCWTWVYSAKATLCRAVLPFSSWRQELVDSSKCCCECPYCSVAADYPFLLFSHGWSKVNGQF